MHTPLALTYLALAAGALAHAADHDHAEPRRIDLRGALPRTLPLAHGVQARAPGPHPESDAEPDSEMLGSSVRAMAKRADGPTYVPVTNEGRDFNYYVEIKVGTPPQTLPVYLDSWGPSLSIFWHNTSTDSYQNTPKEARDPGFNANESSTYQRTGDSDDLFRHGESENGVDVVQMGDETRNQSFRYVHDAWGAWGFGNMASWGFGFNESDSLGKAFWQQELDSWADKQIGLHLKQYRRYEPDAEPDRDNSGIYWVQADGGGLTIGGVNTTMFTGDINYMPLPANPEYWHVPLEGIKVGDTAIDINPPVNNNNTNTTSGNSTSASNGTDPSNGTNSSSSFSQPARISTGNQYILGPASAVAAIYALIPGAEQLPPERYSGSNMTRRYRYPCNSTGPNITLQIGGHEYVLTPEDLIMGVALNGSSDNAWCSRCPAANGSWCIGAMEGAIESEDSASAYANPFRWIIGTAFLKKVYTAFRFDPPAVGFATLSDEALKTSGGGVFQSSAQRVVVGVTGTGLVVALVACAVVLL